MNDSLKSKFRQWLEYLPKLSMSGRVVLVAGCFTLAQWVWLDHDPLLVAGLVLVLLPLLALPLAHLNLSGIEYEREAPAMVHDREPFEIFMRLANTKRWLGGFHFQVEESFEMRIRWTASFFGLLPGQTQRQWQSIQVRKRGLFPGSTYSIHSAFPLGLVRAEQRGGFRSPTVVYPFPRMPRSLPAALMNAGIESSGRTHTHEQGIGDFRALREYRSGDYVKLISWPVSSKRQELISRELERITPERVTILFHSFKPPKKVLAGWTFERGLEMLSGLFIHLAEESIPFDFMADFNRWNRLMVSDRHNGLNQALSSLAAARITASHQLQKLQQIAYNESYAARSVVIVSNTPLRYWTESLGGLPHPVICLDHTQAIVNIEGGVHHAVPA